MAFDSAHAVVGLMGAGPSLEGWENSYPLVVDSLAQQGLTNSRAFSMDLRGFDSARGRSDARMALSTILSSLTATSTKQDP